MFDTLNIKQISTEILLSYLSHPNFQEDQALYFIYTVMLIVQQTF